MAFRARSLKVFERKPGLTVQSYRRSASTFADTKKPPKESNPEKAAEAKAQEVAATQTSTKKTAAELDEELRQKMSSLAGDGGESGIEYEDGQPVAMKRSVKSNMFRYI